MNRTELANTIARVVLEKRCSSFAIVGAPGSGKTSFLRQLRISLAATSPKVVVYGPVSADTFLNTTGFRDGLLDWLEEQELLREAPDREACQLAASEELFWKHVATCLNLSIKRVLVVQVDDVHTNGLEPDHLYEFFAGVRKFCNEWHSTDLSVHFVSCGDWSRAELNALFERYMTSWPFVRDETLFALPDLTFEETRNWMKAAHGTTGVPDLHARYLWELTAGDAPTLNGVLDGFGPDPSTATESTSRLKPLCALTHIVPAYGVK